MEKHFANLHTIVLAESRSQRIYLGGTCNGSRWREDRVIPVLEQLNIDYFNPIVDDWDDSARKNELYQRNKGCDTLLYVITPKMQGVYSIAEVVDDSNKRPESTIFVIERVDGDTFSQSQWRSLNAVARLVEQNGVKTFYSIDEFLTSLQRS